MIAPLTPVTGSGNECDVVVPSPSSPTSLPPQHCTDPSGASAQLWRPPAAIVLDGGNENTPTGVPLFSVDPLPSWPASFWPQQRALPSSSSAQLW